MLSFLVSDSQDEDRSQFACMSLITSHQQLLSHLPNAGKNLRTAFRRGAFAFFIFVGVKYARRLQHYLQKKKAKETV